MPSNSTSLYTTVSSGSVSSNNFTTLYSSPATINATKAYGNSNVEAFLNVGTDGANTVQNINMSGDLTVGGTSNLGPVGNVVITGGTSGYILTTDGSGNLSWSAGASGGNIAGSNTQVQFNNNGSFGASANFTFNSSTKTLTVDNFVGNGYQLSNINSANVAGLGTVAFINLDANSSHVLYGDGTWGVVAAPVSANYAAYAGNVTIAAQPNITSLGTLTSLTVSGNILSGNANLGNLAIANYFSGNGSLLTSINGSNVTGTVGNASHATVADSANSVAGANVTGQVANALVAGTVYTNAQPNITSLGNLTSLSFNNTVTPITPNVGQLFWDTGEHTVSLGMENGVTQQIGLESYIYVKASSAITDGQVVMFTGANGNNVTAAPADVTSVGFRAGYILGVATQNIATNGFGYITTFGLVHGLNTNSYNVGDLLWVNPSVVGGLTNTEPAAPNYQIQVATVTKKSGGDGHIQVIIRINPKLEDLSDVTLTSPTSGQALILDGGNVWVNGNPNVANYAGVVTSSSQPNITSVGTLTGLGVTGNVNVTGNINVTGNLNYSNVTDLVVGDPLIYIGANNSGDLYDLGIVASYNNGTYYHTGIARNHTTDTWTFFDGVVAEPTTVIDWANATYPNLKSGNFESTGNVTASYFIGNGSALTSITGANVTGFVPNANVANYAAIANSVSVANVSGIGNIATINLDGSSSNVLYGNGVWAAVSAVSANYANFAGNVTIAAQPNITSLGTLTTLNVNGTVTANTFTSNIATGTAPFTVTSTTKVTNLNVEQVDGYHADTANTVNTIVVRDASSNITVGNISTVGITTTGTANIANLVLNKFNELVPASANTSTSITPDLSTGSIFRYTANASFTFNSLGNAVAGSSATVIITQDGTGGRTLTSTMKFANASKTLSTAASAIDVISVFYDGTTYYATLSKGYA